MVNEQKGVKIGGASGFWGDAALATGQLLDAGDLDFIVYDYLAEITMAILARARARDAKAGFAADFVSAAMTPNLARIANQGVRIISNAGGMNPEGCAAALREVIRAQGLALKVAVITGDDLLPRLGMIAARGPVDMFTGAKFPDREKVASVNAYLGAFPIAAALDRGADIVITGRCVDSAVTLGACIHAFGWAPSDFDLLAAGSLAGHLLECGPQTTGGNFTDWRTVPGDLADIGYPIAEMCGDGGFVVTKPTGTSGLVSRATVAEQMLYEIADPQAYLMPDVACDFSDVDLVEVGTDRVQVSGARGTGAPEGCKTCLTWADGWRGGHAFGFYGLEAEAKAQAFAEAAIGRSRAALTRMGAADFSEVSIEILGSEAQFGPMRQSGPAREVSAKIAVRHPQSRGIAAFVKEATGVGLAAAPGLCGFAGARPKPMPVLALFSFLTPKAGIDIRVSDEDGSQVYAPARGLALPAVIIRPVDPEQPGFDGPQTKVPLINLAWARSGDKGDIANIGVIARQPAYLPYLWYGLNEAHIRAVFSHVLTGQIERFLLPGTGSINIVLHGALGGGGTSSLRNDPQGKGFAQLLLATPIRVACSLKEEAT